MFYSEAGENAEAMFSIAGMHEQGLGVETNFKKAEKIYKKIIGKAKDGAFEKEAEYPARLAKAFLNAKRTLEGYPTLLRGFESIFGYLSSFY